MAFKNILGNFRTLQILNNSIACGSFSHAYLLSGEKGTGKKTIALELAKAILCENENAPCNTCVSCMKVDKGIHPDLETVRKDEGKQGISVDKIRFIREQAYVRPNESKYRVVIIEDSEDMNLPAANALLKVLEEPPAHIVFILTCNNISRLPETIASRCICLETHEVSENDAKSFLADRFPGNPSLSDALRYGNGNIGRAISFLEDEKCRERFAKAKALAESLITESEFSILESLSFFDGDKEGFLLLLADLDIIMSGVAFSRDELSRDISPSRAVKIHTLIDEARFKIMANGNLSLIQSVFSARLKSIME